MTAPIAGMCCGDCIYYEFVDERSGECRKNAPMPNAPCFVTKMESVGAYKIDTHWPKVYALNWCGQYSSRKKAPGVTEQAHVVAKKKIQPPPARQGTDILKLAPDDGS